MDLGLEIDKAIQSVREDDKQKSNKKRRSRRRNKKQQATEERATSQERDFDAGGLDVYFKNPAGALLRGLSSRLGSEDEADEWEERDGFLFAEEYDSESSDSDSSDSDEDGISMSSTRPRIARDESSRNVNMRYMTVTGNVPPEQLSISTLLSPDELELLTSGENYGVRFLGGHAPDKRKKKKKNRKDMGVAIVKHDFHGMSAIGREEEDAEIDPEEILTSTLFLTSAEEAGSSRNLPMSTKGRNDDLVYWPPPPIVDEPAPPLTAPPRERGAGSLIRELEAHRADRVDYGSDDDHTPPPPDHPPTTRTTSAKTFLAAASSASGSFRPPLRKQTSKVRATNALSMGVNLFAKLVPSSARNEARSSLHGADRFITAKNVPWVIPPPPAPRPPPPDNTDAEQIKLDRELLEMFVEDLHSTLLKLESDLEARRSNVSSMQVEIERIDDEIADLLQPKDVERHMDAATTSQLMSVTSGKIFRVEKYNS
ncbi:Hypothetical Protein FCC1311_019192 [Hondaea fermentalgiana]|uniref:Uncharacterized protein n=1 Tax=Hondaea fermentalgiana TaxID=2315210 RepID=A0A2R5G3X1_9STRA|nr:Hypothetical Protein FCC1311_019192 [Hondaea fermentalgiana]|eukprot:GBG25700.1 Hypothetical Protein FCC1311_019192 [Hondaea fermentalgiana]